jgi:hypothetical protein
MDLLYMYPFLRALLFVCAAFSAVLCALLIVQLVLFERMSKRSQMDFGRLAIAHKTVGVLLACVSALFTLAFLAGALLIAQPIQFDGSKPPYSIDVQPNIDEKRSASLTTYRPDMVGGTWGQSMPYHRHKAIIPEGDGIIEGSILVDGNGAPGESIRLILNEGYHTQYASTDEQGNYRIKVPKGEYTYNGWRLDPRHDWSSLDGKILMYNGVVRKKEGIVDCEPREPDESREEFHAKLDEIFRTLPPEESEEKVFELYNKTYPNAKERNRYPSKSFTLKMARRCRQANSG